MKFLDQLQSLIGADPERMRVLKLVRELDLPDCWVAAGFVRNCVWDFMHQREPSLLSQDIDVIWYDPLQATAARDAIVEATLTERDSTSRWSVKNQARMHARNADASYLSAYDAMKHWPETATAVGVRLNAEAHIEVNAPFSLDDLFALVVRPTERFMAEKRSIYANRIHTKKWQVIWPNLSIELSC